MFSDSLAITTGNVIFGLLVGGVGKHGISVIKFQQLAQIHKRGVVRDARCLCIL